MLQIHANVTSIGANAFNDCTNLNNIICESEAVANLVKGKGSYDFRIYVLQSSGYDDSIFTTAVGVGSGVIIYTGTDADGYKWVKTADNKYYKAIA